MNETDAETRGREMYTKQTKAEQIAIITERRDATAADLRRAAEIGRDFNELWVKDRVRDLEYCNRQLMRLGAIPTM